MKEMNKLGHACRQAGFTMIELLIVVALIMILSAVGLGSYNVSTTRSYDTQRKSDLNQIAKALESFNNDVSRYPISDVDGSIMCYQKDSGVITNVSCSGSKLTIRIDSVVTSYILLPSDPDPSNKYVYDSDGSSYALYTTIHNTQDRDLLLDANGIPIPDPYGVSCGTDQCNYKITEAGLSKTNE